MSLTKEQAIELRDEIARKMSEISRYFPASYKFTLIGRDPEDAFGGLIVSDDDYFKAAECVYQLALGFDKTKVN